MKTEKQERRWDCGSDEYLFYLRKEHCNIPVGAVRVKLLYANKKNKWIISTAVVHKYKEQFRYDTARAKTAGRLKSKDQKTVVVTDEDQIPAWSEFMGHLNKQNQLKAVLRHEIDFTRAEMTFKKLCHKLDRSMVEAE